MPIIVTATGSTVQNIVERALRLIGQLQSGESADANELADGITALNALLDSWRNERLMVFAQRDESFSTVANTSSYTIGPSGDFVTERPLAIEEAFIVASNITYPVTLIDNEQYDSLLYKVATSNWPDRLNYTPTMPNGTITVYPVPNGAYTLHLRTRVPLSSFTSASDPIALPPGWADTLAFNLAVLIAPEYDREASATVVRRAMASKRAVELVNSQRIKLDNEIAVAFARRRSRIISDT